MSEPELNRMAASRADLIRHLVAQREANGLTQTEIAARMGTSQSAVARIEAGTGDVRASTLERYAAAVGAHLDWRLGPETGGRYSMTNTAMFPGPPEIPGTPWDPRRPVTPQPGQQPGQQPGPLPPTRVWLAPDTDDRLYDRLLEKRIVLVSGVLDDEAVTRLSAQLLTLDADSGAPIRVELQNLRAELPAALTAMGILDTLHAEVRSNASGDISGPALGVLAACPVRTGYPNATFTFAEPKLDLGGALTASALAAREQQVNRMLDSLYYRIAEVTGREADEIRDNARQGRVLTAAEALGYGLLTARTAPGRD